MLPVLQILSTIIPFRAFMLCRWNISKSVASRGPPQ
jgi:hypothetical protein